MFNSSIKYYLIDLYLSLYNFLFNYLIRIKKLKIKLKHK